MILSIAMLFPAMLSLAGADPCDLPSGRDRNCNARRGHCFDLVIDNRNVEPLRDLVLRERLRKAVPNKEVCWTVKQPIAGDFGYQAQANSVAPDFLGTLGATRVTVYPLGDYQIATKPRAITEPTVRIGGQPVLTQAQVIDQERIPDGEYVVVFRQRGLNNNYDDKAVYLRVAAGDAPAAH